MIKTAQRGFSNRRGGEGFTLVELLVVIAIIAVLAAVVILVINPVELTARSRDATRLSDLTNLQQAINVTVQEDSGKTANIYCGALGNTYPCSASSNGSRGYKTDGTGWVPINIGAQTSISLSKLPADPSEGATRHYTYCADATGYKIYALLESTQYAGKMTTDGGPDNAHYEVGSELGLSCTY